MVFVPLASDMDFASSETDFDGVDDLPQGEESTSIASDKTKERLNNLIPLGNEAFSKKNMEEAIRIYSEAYKIHPTNSVVLSNRSAAFCHYSNQLRNRPAALSEVQPLLGMDPMKYAELALKDAEKLFQLHKTWPKSYYRKAMALILLEQYDNAREVVLSGLQINPYCIPLQLVLANLDKQVEVKSLGNLDSKRSKVERTDDFDCTLCLKLLYDPVTTPCGHTFCRFCLLQSMDHGNKCPMCRTVLLLNPRAYSLSVTLNNIIQKFFPEEYAERKADHKNLTHSAKNILPLFVMDVVLPQQKLALNIFEPRYRLMIRRIMEGSRRMGMVGIDPLTNSVADVGTEVEICECEPLPDGRFMLQVEGCQRFKVVRSWDQDGYRVAEIESINDTVPPNNTKESEDLQNMAREAGELAHAWTTTADRTTRQYVTMLSQGAEIPDPQDPEKFSFWLANRLNVRPFERLELLRLTDTREVSTALSNYR
eukprot:TRINITY_DN2977_c0_g1_i7.p1 TRINITY_DN2977_c0_g1~~TRINITY_DN2977_c0_g1_i7.p1  ORF type:complete len:481 (+),score=75.80 TRINITY_DN2977_c0_g1_i7:72-1514(+)